MTPDPARPVEPVGERDDWEFKYHVDPDADGWIIGEGVAYYAPAGLTVVTGFVDGVRTYRSFRPDSGTVIGEWNYAR